jgi:hypothetical protein
MPETNLRSKDGHRFVADISGNKNVEGEIAVYDGAVYLLQNKADGSHGGPLRGYKYSWTVGYGDADALEGHGVSNMKVGSNKIDKNSSHSSFKVGQRVKYKSSISEPMLMGLAGRAPGCEGTITCVNSAGMNVKFDANGKIEAVYCDDMEPIVLEAKKAGTFKKGDRVKVKDDVTVFAYGGATELKSRYGVVNENSTISSVGISFDDGHTYRMDPNEMEHTTVQKGDSATTAAERPCRFKVGDKVRMKPGLIHLEYGGNTTMYTTGVVIEARGWRDDKSCVEISVRWDLDGHRYAMSDNELLPYDEAKVDSSARQYRTGQTFTCKLRGKDAEGIILVNSPSSIFLLQNVHDGSSCSADKRGYKYSYTIEDGSDATLKKSYINVVNLKLDVPLTKMGDTSSPGVSGYRDGQTFSAKINGLYVEGIVRVVSTSSTDKVFLCQNKVSGTSCSDKGGYTYSWSIISGSAEELKQTNIGVTELKLDVALSTDPPKLFKIGDNVKVKPAYDGKNTFGVFETSRTGCKVTRHAAYRADHKSWECIVDDRYTILEKEFELVKPSGPKPPEPRFKVGDVLQPKRYLSNNAYGGDMTSFVKSVIIAEPTWDPSKGDWRYLVNIPGNSGVKLAIKEGEFDKYNTGEHSTIKISENTLPVHPEPKFKAGDKVKVKPAHARSIVFGDFDEAHTGCVVASWGFDEDKGDWAYKSEHGWNFIEYQFELCNPSTTGPSRPEPKFKPGDIICAKAERGRLTYGGFAEAFKSATVMSCSDYPAWESKQDSYDYRVKTADVNGYIICEKDFELKSKGSIFHELLEEGLQKARDERHLDVGIDTGWIDPKITKEPDLTFKTGPRKFSL